MIDVVYMVEGGVKLWVEKGINFFDSVLIISGLMVKDKEDLIFVVKYVDVINFFFVNCLEDVIELFDCLKELKVREDIGLVLKIEM